MEKRVVILPQEVWDRLITVLNLRYKNDPDTEEILLMIQSQLHFNPSDESAYPLPRDFKQLSQIEVKL